MKDTELNKILQGARPPERPAEYWEQFPPQIMAEIRRWEERAKAPVRAGRPGSGAWCAPAWMAALRGKPLAALGFSVVVVCLALGMAGLWMGWSSAGGAAELARAQKCFRETAALFPHQLQAIVFDRLGARVVLAEKADVPASPPLYLKICGPEGCEQFVTFSGQQIRVNGDSLDVLVDRRGDVLVVGAQWVWSSAEPAGKAGRYRIEARPLPAPS
jgi:hypothetical protein